jgi:hypothetical protein
MGVFLTTMGVLSDFAVNIGASYAYGILSSNNKNLEKELSRAFEQALKKWSPSTDIRRKKRAWLKTKTAYYFENSGRISEISESEPELYKFFLEYEQTIRNYPTAFGYLSEIKNESNHNEIRNLVNKLTDTIKQEFQEIRGYLHSHNWDLIFALCEQSIKQLAPRTTIRILEFIQNSQEIKKSDVKNQLQSKIQFLKGKCYAHLREAVKSNLAYIEAYEIEPENIEYAAFASVSYATLKEYHKSNELSNCIILKDRTNIYAWMAKVLTCEKTNIESLLVEIPITVKREPKFLITIDSYLFQTFPNLDVTKYYDVFIIIDDLTEAIDSTNINRHTYNIRTDIFNLLNSNEIVASLQKEGLTKEVREVKENIEKFLTQIDITELSHLFEDFRAFIRFFEFLESRYDSNLEKMRLHYEESSIEMKPIIFELLIESWLVQDKPSKALEIIDLEPEPTIQLLSLKLELLLTEKNEDEIVKTATHIVEKSKENLSENAAFLFFQLFQLVNFGYYQKLSLESMPETAEADDLTIIQLFNILNDTIKQSDSAQAILERITAIKEVTTIQHPNLEVFIAKLLYLNQDYFSALEIFKRTINLNFPSVELGEYFECRFRLNDDAQALMTDIEKCRKEFPFEASVTQMELNLAIREKAWGKAVEISEYYIRHVAYDEFVIFNYLYALDELNDIEKIRQVSENISVGMFSSFETAQFVAVKLNEMNINKGMEMLFELASNKKNQNARKVYHSACIMTSGSKMLSTFNTVEEGTFVKFKVNSQNERLIYISSDDMDSMKFIGRHTGDAFEIERSFRTDKIRILQVHNKYVNLWEEISEEGKNSFTGPECRLVEYGNPSNISKLIPLSTPVLNHKSQIDENIRKYNMSEISFSELALFNYHSNYLNTFNFLCSDGRVLKEVQGNEKVFDKFEIKVDTELVLDFTSLLELYFWSYENELQVSSKFLISSYLTELLEKDFNQLDSNTTNSIDKLKLMNWIDTNCSITNGDEKFRNQYYKDIEFTLQRNYLLDTVAIFGNNGNRMVIANDSIFRKLLIIPDFNTVPTRILIDRLTQ